MVRTEPFRAVGAGREYIIRLSETEGYEVEEDGDKVILKNATKHDLDGTNDCLYDKATRVLEEADVEIESDTFDNWLNNSEFKLSENKQVGEAEELREAAMNLRDVDYIGAELPHSGNLPVRINTQCYCENALMDDLTDKEARREVHDWIRNSKITLEVEVTEDKEVEVKGVNVN